MTPDHPGYIFRPLTNLPEIGYGEVEIHIGTQPIERFFDTRRAIFLVADQGFLRKYVVEHPYLGEEGADSWRVCAGRFYLYETDGDEHIGFSLGGLLKIRQDGDWIICKFTSPAPIFNLSEDPDATNRWLADEFEAMLARRRASYSDDDTRFEQRLQNADPLDLFVAALNELEQNIHSLSVAARSSYQEQYSLIKHTKHLLEEADLWPSVPPSMNNLL